MRAGRPGLGGPKSGDAVVSDSLPGRVGCLSHRLQPVADAVPRLDERVRGCRPVDLLAEATDEDVYRPVAMRLAAAPQLLQQLVARDDAAAVESQLVEEAELRRQIGRASCRGRV